MPRHRRLQASLRAALLVAALAGIAPGLRAQVRVVPGARVRAAVGATQLVGTVAAIGDSSLVVRTGRGEPVTVPFASLAWIDVSEGRHSRVWAIVAGAVVGSTLGGLVDGGTSADVEGDGTSSWASGLASLGGAAAGAYVGSRFKADRWVRAALPGTPPVAAGPGASGRSDVRGPVMPGTRVRYWSAGEPGATRTARVVRLDGDTLTLQPDDALQPVRVALPALQRLDVSTGWHRHTGTGVAIGAPVGGVLGIVGAVAVARSQPDPWSGFWAVMLGVPVGAFVGGLVGAGVGAGIGAAVHQEGWRRIDVPVSLTARPTGRFALEVTLAH